MGDKPSVEAKNFQPDIDDHNLYRFVPVNAQDAQTTGAVADTSFTDRTLSNFDDTSGVLASTQQDVLMNGVWHNCYVSPSLSERFASSPKRKMKHSKSANHNMNGDTVAVPCPDGKRSLSMEEASVGIDEHPADSSVVDSSVTASHSEATTNNPVPLEPSSPSTSSTVTVVSVVHADNEGRRQKSGGRELSASAGLLQSASSSSSPSPMRHGADMLAPRDRTKHTLGDVLVEIESRSASLLQQTNYATPAAVADLQFLAYQSRYSMDLNIKRRIITKLVDSGLIDIILHVLSSVHEAECFHVSSELSSVDGASLTGSVEGDPEGDVLDGMKNLRSVITLTWNATDKSPLLSEQCIRRGVVSMLLQLLESPHLAVSELHDKTRMFIVKGSLGILSSIVRSCDDDTTHEVYRSAGAVKALQQFLRCSLLAVRTKSLIILSYIATESENDVIHAADKHLVFAVKMLQSALESDNHYSSKYGYWAIEIVSGVNRLAGYELNKERLFAAGLLSLCFQLLDSSCTDDEILVATQTFWILSFNSAVRAEVNASHLYMQVLEQLSTNHSREEIKRTAASVVWMIKHFSSSRFSSPSAALSAAAENNNRVLVISHHTSGQTVLKIRSQLRSVGYRVHIDPDMRSGSSGMESLVENVDRSGVILVFLSNRLKNSAACRSEVEYAVNADKAVIPIRIHRSYVLDGWLSTALANHSVLNFADTDDFEAGMSQLLQRVSAVTGLVATSDAGGSESRLVTSQHGMAASHSGSVDASPTAAAMTSTAAAAAAACSVMSWSTHDVQAWLHNNDLGTLADRFRDLTGKLLLEVRRMQLTAPESFYTSLRADLSLDFVAMMKFTRALSTLEESTE